MFDAAWATIAVSDLERARRFYEDTLGLKTKDERADGVTYEGTEPAWPWRMSATLS